ncbi:hypothetical protein [Phytohabitans kaempferiae]|uniref:Uncharacterized protein n=1 Tax=Phytohabitans kaempferiae TaxID=1620943 RepID=A0ABV6MBP6_9ACTN
MKDRIPRLGIDIGRVIIDGTSHPEGGDTAFFAGDTATMLRTPAVPGAFEAIARLVARFEGRAWLVSKCGERVQRRTLHWLDHHDFAGRTGIAPDRVRFCRRRPDKAIHCAELGITHFVDDKLDVHEALRGMVPHLYLFGRQARCPAWLAHTPTWPAAEAAITAALAGTPAGRDR